jgi:hypothetical protein
MPVSVQWPHQHDNHSPEKVPSVHADSSDCASVSLLPVSTNFSAAALYQETAFAEVAPDSLLPPPAPDVPSHAPYGRPGPSQWGFSPTQFARTVSAEAALPENAYRSQSAAYEGYQPALPTSVHMMPRRSPSQVCFVSSLFCVTTRHAPNRKACQQQRLRLCASRSTNFSAAALYQETALAEVAPNNLLPPTPRHQT